MRTLLLATLLSLSACAVPASSHEPPPEAAPRPQDVRGVVPAPEPLREATLVFGGDLLWHDTTWLSAAEDHARTGRGRTLDLDPMFATLRPLVSGADLAFCHEEVPFAGWHDEPRSYPLFAAPPEIAAWIGSMGWDACTTASNHALDQGYDGLVRTADLLGRAGVRHVGTFRSPAERRRPVVLSTDGGVRVGIVAGTYGTNGLPLPEGREWSVSWWDAPNLLTQARAARAAGADVVVVHLHGGHEYDALPTPEQVALVERLTRSPDVDLVVGEHAHVVQPITRVHGKLVVYGMGNQVAQQEVTRPATYEGITVEVRVGEQPGGGFRVRGASYLPTQWNEWAPGRPIRIERATGDHLRSVRSAVHALGRSPGVRELG